MRGLKISEFDAIAVLHRYVIRNIKSIILKSFEKGPKFDIDIAVNAVYGCGDNYRRYYTRKQLTNLCNIAIQELLNEGKIKQDYLVNSSKLTYFIPKTQEIGVRENNDNIGNIVEEDGRV